MALRAAIAFLGFMLLLPSAAVAEKRVALVIGNGAYIKVPKLDNPKNDAAAMEAMFKAAGFDTVVRANDLGVAAMRRALQDFSDVAHDADIAVVFYAGHGMEVSGTNYLIPTDAVLERDIDVRDEAVPLDRVSEILEPVKRLRFIILDACRDNPFVRSMRRTLATRTVRSGYGEIDEKLLPPNTLVAYAQRAGATAEDGAGANSPYTIALLKHLPTPGLDVELALRRVRDDVLKTTRNRQEPFKYGSLGGTEVALVVAKPLQPAEPKAPGRLSEAAEAWDRTKDLKNIALLEAFIGRYKDTFYAELARARIEELKKQQVAVAAKPTMSSPVIFDEHDGKELFTVGGGARERRDATRLDDCRAVCRSEETCKAFEFKRDDRTCRLFSIVERSAPNRSFYSGVRLSANQPPDGESQFEEREGRELFTVGGGGRERSEAKNLADCRSLCRSELDCKAFEYKYDAGMCRLFSLVERSASNRNFYSGIRLSANQPPKGQVGFDEQEGREIFTVGGGARERPDVKTLDDCRSMCRSELACKAFEFKRDDLTCRLFSHVERSAFNRLFYSRMR
jgi:uncharacterized caspase-like protein